MSNSVFKARVGEFETLDGVSQIKCDKSTEVVYGTQPSPADVGGTGTVTVTQLFTGLLSSDPAGAATWTLPTNALIQAAWRGTPAAGDCFDFYVINKANADEPITIAAGSGGSTDGNMVVEYYVGTALNSGSAHFRLRIDSASAYTVYRLA